MTPLVRAAVAILEGSGPGELRIEHALVVLHEALEAGMSGPALPQRAALTPAERAAAYRRKRHEKRHGERDAGVTGSVTGGVGGGLLSSLSSEVESSAEIGRAHV